MVHVGVHQTAFQFYSASMRPPEFTGGNPDSHSAAWSVSNAECFNEAAGIHRRKHAASHGSSWPQRSDLGFNEAAGIHRRKRDASAGIAYNSKSSKRLQ